MRVHCIQHVPFEGLGSIGPWLDARGATVSVSRLFDGDVLADSPDFEWLIVLGGPMSVNDVSAHPWLEDEKAFVAEAVASDKVVLGVCLGAQLIASSLGSEVVPARAAEIGWFPVEPVDPTAADGLAAPFAKPLEVFHWHEETFGLPTGARRLARSEACENQAFALGDRVLGLQFHLEMTLAGAKELIEACRHALRPGDWIHTEREMLEDDRRFDRINRVMADVLERLARGSAAR